VAYTISNGLLTIPSTTFLDANAVQGLLSRGFELGGRRHWPRRRHGKHRYDRADGPHGRHRRGRRARENARAYGIDRWQRDRPDRRVPPAEPARPGSWDDDALRSMEAGGGARERTCNCRLAQIAALSAAHSALCTALGQDAIPGEQPLAGDGRRPVAQGELSPSTAYATEPPSPYVVGEYAREAKQQAQRIATSGVGAGKVAYVRVEIHFHDGTIIAHEADGQ